MLVHTATKISSQSSVKTRAIKHGDGTVTSISLTDNISNSPASALLRPPVTQKTTCVVSPAIALIISCAVKRLLYVARFLRDSHVNNTPALTGDAGRRVVSLVV